MASETSPATLESGEERTDVESSRVQWSIKINCIGLELSELSLNKSDFVRYN